MECRLGYAGTHLLVNEYRAPGQPTSFCQYHYLKGETLNPKIELVSRRKQGSTDPESGWVVARFNLATQLLVHFGKLDFANDNNQPEFFKDLPSL